MDKLRSLINEGNLEGAVAVAEGHPRAGVLVTLLSIATENIGMADLSLMNYIMRGFFDDISDVISKIISAPKSQTCLQVLRYFREPMLDSSRRIEPFPFEQNLNEPLERIANIVGMMYFKGMEIWELLSQGLDPASSDAEFLKIIRSAAAILSENNEDESIIWCFALLWKRSILGINDSLPNVDPVGQFPLKRLANYCQSSQYFYVESDIIDMSSIDIDVGGSTTIYTTDTRISSICGHKESVKTHLVGSAIKTSKYTYKSICDQKIFPRFADLGTLQVFGATVVYCWLENTDGEVRRYVLRPFPNRAAARNASAADSLLEKYKFGGVPWCRSSVVIGMNGFIDSGVDGVIKVKEGRTYYTLSLALPYFLPVSVGLRQWFFTPAANRIILLSLLKYIFGIADRTLNSIGVYIDSRTKRLEICSFDHAPSLTEPVGPVYGKLGKRVENYLQDPKKFIKERKWLSELTVDADYFVRLSEVLTIIKAL